MISAEGCSSSRQDKDRRPVKRTPRENIHPCACTARTQVTGQCSMWSNPPPLENSRKYRSYRMYLYTCTKKKKAAFREKRKKKDDPYYARDSPNVPAPSSFIRVLKRTSRLNNDRQNGCWFSRSALVSVDPWASSNPSEFIVITDDFRDGAKIEN